MRIFSFAAVLIAGLAPVGYAQTGLAPVDGRVSNSHIHLFTKDAEAQRHFWVDIMGASARSISPIRDVYTLPKVLVFVDKTPPTAGTEGSIVNHVGFRVRDMKDILAKVAAAHYNIQVVNPNKDDPKQAFFLGPDDVRIELLAGPNLTTVSENHQVHFFTPDPDAMEKWYASNFGGMPQAFGKVKMLNLSGVTLIFSPSENAVTATKGRALDHIGFEIKDLEDFCKTLEANGVKLDAPYRKSPQMGVAFVTDPWGTRVELTEHAAPISSAEAAKPLQQ